MELPQKAGQLLEERKGGSIASYAIRFAASFEGVEMVLSGMSSLEQMKDNLGYMKEFQPLNEEEFAAVWKVSDILSGKDFIPCTACRYCVAGCPKGILIPELFRCLNDKKEGKEGAADYAANTDKGHGKASACVGCKQCEKVCPQHLPITKYLKQTAQAFE